MDPLTLVILLFFGGPIVLFVLGLPYMAGFPLFRRCLQGLRARHERKLLHAERMAAIRTGQLPDELVGAWQEVNALTSGEQHLAAAPLMKESEHA